MKKDGKIMRGNLFAPIFLPEIFFAKLCGPLRLCDCFNLSLLTSSPTVASLDYSSAEKVDSWLPCPARTIKAGVRREICAADVKSCGAQHSAAPRDRHIRRLVSIVKHVDINKKADSRSEGAQLLRIIGAKLRTPNIIALHCRVFVNDAGGPCLQLCGGNYFAGVLFQVVELPDRLVGPENAAAEPDQQKERKY